MTARPDVVVVRCSSPTKGGHRCAHQSTDPSGLCVTHLEALNAPRCSVVLAHGARRGEACGRIVRDVVNGVCATHVTKDVVVKGPELTLRAVNVQLDGTMGALVLGQRLTLSVEAEVVQVRGVKGFAQPAAVTLRRGAVPSGSVDVSKPAPLVEVAPEDDGEGPAADFWSHVVPRGECWAWSGPTDEVTGAPVAVVDGRERSAARVAWSLEHGRLGARDRLVRRCRTGGCISPEHHALG